MTARPTCPACGSINTCTYLGGYDPVRAQSVDLCVCLTCHIRFEVDAAPAPEAERDIDKPGLLDRVEEIPY